jgi:hypothetical protein
MRYPAAVELAAAVVHTAEGVGGEPRLQMLEMEALDIFRQPGIRPGLAATLGSRGPVWRSICGSIILAGRRTVWYHRRVVKPNQSWKDDA